MHVALAIPTTFVEPIGTRDRCCYFRIPGPELHTRVARALPPISHVHATFAARAQLTEIRANLKRDARLVLLARGLAAGKRGFESIQVRTCLTDAFCRCANFISAVVNPVFHILWFITTTFTGGVEAPLAHGSCCKGNENANGEKYACFFPKKVGCGGSRLCVCV